MKSAIRSLLFVLLPAAPLAGQAPHQREHKHLSAEQYLKVLNHPERDKWQKPHEVIQALQLRSDEVVADIGAGGGYFALRFAHLTAKVYAVDIDAKLLEAAAKGAPSHLVTVLAAPDDPKLADASVDTVFFCDVLHHIENRPAYYRKVDKALKPGGRIVMIDFHKRDLPVGPPVEMKLSEAQVVEEMRAAGFRKTRSFDFLPHQYFLVFHR